MYVYHMYTYIHVYIYICIYIYGNSDTLTPVDSKHNAKHRSNATRNTHSTFPYVFLYSHTLHTCCCVWNSDTLTSVDPEHNAEPPSNTTRNTHNTFFWRGGGGTPYGEKNTFVRINIISRFYATVVHLRSARPSPLWKWISF